MARKKEKEYSYRIPRVINERHTYMFVKKTIVKHIFLSFFHKQLVKILHEYITVCARNAVKFLIRIIKNIHSFFFLQIVQLIS